MKRKGIVLSFSVFPKAANQGLITDHQTFERRPPPPEVKLSISSLFSHTSTHRRAVNSCEKMMHIISMELTLFPV
jgi:hypothetical protein